jgi:hypothetical protein
MLPSQMPSQVTSACSAFAYSTASADERMSGSVTISSSGVPARLRSMPVMPAKILRAGLAGVLFEVGAGQANGPGLVADEGTRPLPPCTTGISYWLIW